MSQPTYPPANPVYAYSPTYTKSPAETKAAVDAAYAAKRASYKAGQDAVAADYAEVAGLNPQIDNLSPATKTAGSATFTLTVNGFDFDPGAQVRWAGVAQATTRVSAKQLTTSITAAQVVGAGSFAVTVINSSGKISNSIAFVVT